MTPTDIERARDFDHRFAKAQATDVVDLRWGYAVLQPDYPQSHSHNRIAITADASAMAVLEATDRILDGAGLEHRYVSADDALGERLAPDMVSAGYEHERIVTMSYVGTDVGPPVHAVHAVSAEVMRPAILRDWRIAIEDASEETYRQLADREELYSLGADITALVVYEGSEIAAHAYLYLDRVDEVAQFENLVTNKHYQGRGYAKALLFDALSRGREAGAELSILTADLDDWVHEWYVRVGYVEIGRTHHFSRH